MTLEELRDACGPNKHEQVLILIEACICEHIDTRAQIRTKMIELGFNGSHVVMLLNEATGDAPARHRWYCDGEGHYHLHCPLPHA